MFAGIDSDGSGSRVDQLQAIRKYLAGFTTASAAVTLSLSSRGGFGPGYGNTISRLRRAPEQIQEAKENCVRGGTHMALALVASHDLEVNLWQLTKGFPKLDAAGNLFNRNEVH
jgi:hypothetical protein